VASAITFILSRYLYYIYTYILPTIAEYLSYRKALTKLEPLSVTTLIILFNIPYSQNTSFNILANASYVCLPLILRQAKAADFRVRVSKSNQ